MSTAVQSPWQRVFRGIATYPGSMLQRFRQRPVFASVERYCMFIGYGRSGHSLTGALLNAHPEMVIAHELDALGHVQQGVGRDRLFQMLLDRDQEFCRGGGQWYGYDYRVPDQWQGRFQHLRVIGDKKGGMSTLRLREAPHLLRELERLVRVPLFVIHVVRNPYDNISTISTRRNLSLEHCIDDYFALSETIVRIIADHPDIPILTLWHEDFLANPTLHLESLCGKLGLTASPEYLRDCTSIIFKEPSQSRRKVSWPPELIARVAERMKKFPHLDGYSFDE